MFLITTSILFRYWSIAFRSSHIRLLYTCVLTPAIFREHLLSYITEGDDSQALGSLCLFATLLQTKGVLDYFLYAYAFHCLFPRK